MRGDRVEIVIDAGGTARTYEVVATRAGRRVEVSYGRSVVEVTELTRVVESPDRPLIVTGEKTEETAA